MRKRPNQTEDTIKEYQTTAPTQPKRRKPALPDPISTSGESEPTPNSNDANRGLDHSTFPWNLPNPSGGSFNYCWMNVLIHSLDSFIISCVELCPQFNYHPFAVLAKLLYSQKSAADEGESALHIRNAHRECLKLVSVMTAVASGSMYDVDDWLFDITDPDMLRAGGWCPVPREVCSSFTLYCSRCRTGITSPLRDISFAMRVSLAVKDRQIVRAEVHKHSTQA